MNVENFWLQLKHDSLHHLLRPRLDQLLWILLTEVTPQYVLRARYLEDGWRVGRSKGLSTYQKYFKRDWQKLKKRLVSGKDYNTDISSWTCRCGQQKFNAHHICKHLVQAVQAIHTPPPSFWAQVIRRRTTPLYRHPVIQQELRQSQSSLRVNLEDGSITDGDDHVWKGESSTLKGGGTWMALRDQVLEERPNTSVLRKRRNSGTSSDLESNVVASNDINQTQIVDVGGYDSGEEENVSISNRLKEKYNSNVYCRFQKVYNS